MLAYEGPGHPDLPNLLERVRSTYDEPFAIAHAIRIQEQVFKADPLKREQLRPETVMAYHQHAMKFPPGPMRMSFLEDAAKIATQYGLTDLAGKAVEEMQQMTLDDLDLKAFTMTLSIPADPINDYVANFIGQPSLADAIRLLVTSEAPTGNLDRNRSATRKSAEQVPFAAPLPATHVGDDGLARYTAAFDDDRLDQQLARAEVMAVGIAGPVTARILDGLLAKFAPSPQDLVELL